MIACTGVEGGRAPALSAAAITVVSLKKSTYNILDGSVSFRFIGQAATGASIPEHPSES
jgi:hypothetical protein